MESKSHISYRYRVSRSTTLHNCYLDRYYTNNLCNAIMNTGQMRCDTQARIARRHIYNISMHFVCVGLG